MPMRTKSSFPKLVHRSLQDYRQFHIVPVGWRKVPSEKSCATFWREGNSPSEIVPAGLELLSLARHFAAPSSDSAVLVDNPYRSRRVYEKREWQRPFASPMIGFKIL